MFDLATSRLQKRKGGLVILTFLKRKYRSRELPKRPARPTGHEHGCRRRGRSLRWGLARQGIRW